MEQNGGKEYLGYNSQTQCINLGWILIKTATNEQFWRTIGNLNRDQVVDS